MDMRAGMGGVPYVYMPGLDEYPQVHLFDCVVDPPPPLVNTTSWNSVIFSVCPANAFSVTLEQPKLFEPAFPYRNLTTGFAFFEAYFFGPKFA